MNWSRSMPDSVLDTFNRLAEEKGDEPVYVGDLIDALPLPGDHLRNVMAVLCSQGLARTHAGGWRPIDRPPSTTKEEIGNG